MAPIIECVVVCVNYSDFLAWTLPASRNQFDRMVVVTTPEDKATQDLCERYDVECVVTSVFTENGDKFAKGRGINAGLERLSRRGWLVHMDADVYLPPKTGIVLRNLPLDPTKIYGADRLMCPSAAEFAAYLDCPGKVQSDWVFVHSTAFPMGVRLAQYCEPGGGYVPIGYFQLWNPSGSGVERYPEKHGTAARTDFQMGTTWPRSKRELLPEIVLIHLESAPGMGHNWEGRTTPLFRLGLGQMERAPEPSFTVAADPPAPPAPRRRRYGQPWLLLLFRDLLHRTVSLWLRVITRLRRES